ncbi:ciliogenesis-associated TTC17-interacting protein-like isoform X4 [Xenia sp. Carnegie-2017]|uniref:ciliogenesis-associated TTC17-interacting protein-like isoform X4 n=1 Tax=Xenia sp. Carnegie-2017 TaxID=2897299 RepID=UPI001F03F8B1|nr:ciliogenesis-associated TTC17-interacting protein-like isoform X4 [Xenia sp. Carnegie-2017]
MDESSEESKKTMEERQKFDFTANAAAVEFLARLSREDWRGLCFSEKLMTMCGNKNYGEFELTISDGEWRGMQCYMIHLTEENIDADAPKLMSIIAHVSETFTLLEQSTHEYIKIPERTMDVKTLIVREAGKYVVQKTVSQDNCERKTLETFSTTQMEGFICEACHVVLQRFFLKKGFPENAVFLTFDSETNISSMSFTFDVTN